MTAAPRRGGTDKEGVAALGSMIEEVEADMPSLRTQAEAIEERLDGLGDEVRTRRLVLTDGNDRPAVTVEAAEGAVELRLAALVRVVPAEDRPDPPAT